MVSTEVVIRLRPTEAEWAEVEKLAREQRVRRSGDAASEDVSVSTNSPAWELWHSVGYDSRTREVLRLLPDSLEQALTPEELAIQMRPGHDDNRLPKASVRASILNARRVEKRLREEAKIDREVIVVDWSRYAAEGAGRYYVRPEDKAVIDAL